MTTTTTLCLQIINIIIDNIYSIRLNTFFEIENGFLSFIYFIISSIILIQLATLTSYLISTESEGSGIPEIKTILSGITIYRYLSTEALTGKIISTILSLVGGASLGRVGPYIHISACICNKLIKLNMFKPLIENNNIDSIKSYNNENNIIIYTDNNNKSSLNKYLVFNNMISASSAIAVSTALGTPLGGLIFSIEVTSSYYKTSNLLKSLFAAVLSSIISNIIEFNKYSYLFENSDLYDLTETNQFVSSSFIDVIMFIILAIICGLIGSFMSKLVAYIALYRKTSSIKIIKNKLLYSLICSLVISIIMILFPHLMEYDKKMLSKVFEKDDFNITGINREIIAIRESYDKPKISYLNNNTNNNTNILLNSSTFNYEYYFPYVSSIYESSALYLFSLFVFKTIITIISLTMNIPSGLFTPIFLSGAYLGRFVGYILNTYIFSSFIIHPESVYSIIGAACLMSACTHTVSVSIIVFELTGRVNFIFILLMSSIVSSYMSKTFTISFFDVFLEIRELPHLPNLLEPISLYKKTINQLVIESIDYKKYKNNINYKLKNLKNNKEVYNDFFKKNNYVNYKLIVMNYEDFTYLNCIEMLLNIDKYYKNDIPIINNNSKILFTISIKKIMKLIHFNTLYIINKNQKEENNIFLDCDIEDNNKNTTSIYKLIEIVDYLLIKYNLSNIFKYEKDTIKLYNNLYDNKLSNKKNKLNSFYINYLKNFKYFKNKAKLAISKLEKEKKNIENILTINKYIEFINKLKMMLNCSVKIDSICINNANSESIDKNNFIDIIIDLNNRKLLSYEFVSNEDKSVFYVDNKLLIIKLHFIFTFLSVDYVYVTEFGKLIGYISKEYFIQTYGKKTPENNNSNYLEYEQNNTVESYLYNNSIN